MCVLFLGGKMICFLAHPPPPVHFHISLIYNNICTNTTADSFCSFKSLHCCFASAAEANSLTVLSLSSTEGWRGGEKEGDKERERKSREMDETEKGSEGSEGRKRGRWILEQMRNVTEGDWQGRKKGMGSVERRERQKRERS